MNMTFKKQLYKNLFNAKLLNCTECTKEEIEQFAKLKDDELPDNIIVAVAYDGEEKAYYSCGVPVYDGDTKILFELEKYRVLKSIKTAVWIIAGIAIVGVIIGTFIALLVH